MLTYSFQTGGRTPLYEQLYCFIREDIAGGLIRGGEKLPSKRAFAKQLGVSVITVETAYDQLLAEGYIASVPRKGYFAADLGEAVQERINGTNEDIRDVSGEESGIPELKLRADSPEKGESAHWLRADFTSNQTEPDRFPFTTWAKLSREMLRDHRAELMINPPAAGVPGLREAVAQHLRSWRGIETDPHQIIVGAGTDYLYGLLIQLLGFDKVYASEEPGYGKLSRVFAAYHVAHRRILVDPEGLSIERLRESDAQVVHVTPSHHFPTGVTMPAARRYELLKWADAGADRYILEDDYDSEFRMNVRPLPSLFSMDRREKVIYMNTFTKTLASTVRVSYMILPPALACRFEEELSFYACPVPVLTQYTLRTFLSRGYFEKQLNRMRTASRRKRDTLLGLLKESRIGSVITVSEQNAGLHFLMNIAMKQSGEEFLEKLGERGVYMLPLSSFFHTPPPEAQDLQTGYRIGDGRIDHTFLVNYSSVPEENLAEAVQVLEDCLLDGNHEDRLRG